MRSTLFAKRNMGMTLIELIVVIAILAIMGSGAISAIGVLNGRGARKTEASLTSLLSKTKITAMGQSKRAGETVTDADVYLEFCEMSHDTFGAILVGSKDETPVQLTGAGVTISAVIASGIDDALTNPENVDDVRTGSGLRIAFSRQNGSLIPYKIVKDADGNITDRYYVKKLIIRQGNKEIVLRITPVTGQIREEE